jgi:hypothetical protein
MAADLHLCPCCAAHLCVPDGLTAMRCNNCDAELLYIESGGVRGLALLPAIGNVPYSVPQQRARSRFDGSELLHLRRSLLLSAARRRRVLWNTVFFFSVASLFAAFVVGYIGAQELMHPEASDAAVLALFAAILGTPILAYVALYFQGRARLAQEEARKWR